MIISFATLAQRRTCVKLKRLFYYSMRLTKSLQFENRYPTVMHKETGSLSAASLLDIPIGKSNYITSPDQSITKPSLTMPVPVEAGFFVPSTLTRST